MNENENLVPKRRFKEFKNTGTWEQRKLGEHSQILAGGTPKTQIKEYWEPKEIPWMSSGEINKKRLFATDNQISKLGFESSSARWVKENSVLIALAGQGKTRGTVAINEIPLTTNQSIAAIEPDDKLDSEFLFQNLEKRYEELRLASSGDGSRGGLNKQIISDIKIIAPSVKEQSKVGLFFKHLDDTIALHQRKLEKSKALKSAYLSEMFPAEGERKPKRRFAGFTDDWEQRKLIDVAEMFDNLRIPVTASDRVEGNTAYYGANGIQDYVDGFTHDGEFVLIAEDGANDLINYPVNYVKGKIWVNNHAHVVSGKKSELDNLFLTARIKSMNISHWLVGGGRAKLNGDVLKKIPLTLPIYEEQKKIGAFFKQLDDAIALHQRKLEKTKALKSAYLSELFPVEGERKPKRRFAGFIDDWKQGTVGEYGYFYYGKSAPKWSVTKDAIIPCVRYGELYTKFGAKIDKVYSYTNISKENLKFSTGNEVLVPRVGEDPLDFANCSWLSIPNVAIGEMISVYNTEENPLFISYYFNSQLRHAFAKRVEGGNVSNLYFTYLENITISIPNKEEQDTIANFLESLDSVVEHHQHKLEKLKNIKQAYLNELFV